MIANLKSKMKIIFNQMHLQTYCVYGTKINDLHTAERELYIFQ